MRRWSLRTEEFIQTIDVDNRVHCGIEIPKKVMWQLVLLRGSTHERVSGSRKVLEQDEQD